MRLEPNNDYGKKKNNDNRRLDKPHAPPPVKYYVLVGGGRFVYNISGVRCMRFDSLDKVEYSNRVYGLRDNYLSSYGGYATSNPLSDEHILSVDTSNITQEQIDKIRQLGGSVSLSKNSSPTPGGGGGQFGLPSNIYFISNPFRR